MIKNRALSFVAVTIVYVLASVGGIVSYLLLPYSFWLNLLIADVIATVITFVFSVIFKNASVYDPYWSVQPIVIITAYAVGVKLDLVKILPLIAIWFWGVRLTANWGYTFKGLTHQDWRYTMLCEKTGVFYPVINFVGIHLVPTLVVYGCTLPAVYVILLGGKISVLSVLCFILSLLAVLLQLVSDIQMQKFRKSSQGGFIRVGLWKHSRHPNYLGEILMWWGVGLYAFSVLPSMWYLLAGAFANTLLFAFVSIPMADGRQSKKLGFDEYKRQTRVLLPIKKFNLRGE